ncbi:MAG: ABC transporter permease [Halobacteriales archaeon]|nr:ABC transporter permease [Halobacteriales archaeon]
MSRLGRIRSEAIVATRSFLRRRTAVFFTFFFPVLLIVIFGALIQTGGDSGGLFTEPTAYYVPGYLAVVVLFTPLSRIGSTVARYRDGNRFEKLATTPLSRREWLAAHTVVNVLIIGLACLIILGLILVITDAAIRLSPLIIPFIVAAVTVFCGVGALLGWLAESQDGVIAASNGIALPLIFLSETFVPPTLLPSWFRPLIALSPLTYFARGVRVVTTKTATGGAPTFFETPGGTLAILAILAIGFFIAGARAIPRTD